MEHAAHTRISESLLKWILLTGLLAGTLDILAAFLSFYLINGGMPITILHYIAAAVFGMEAFQGGAPMALMGLFFHYIIAMGWTTLYFTVYPYLSNVLSKNKYLSGIAYGAFVWLCMNLVVVPLTGLKTAPFDAAKAGLQMAILMVCIGLPIALRAHKFFARGK